MSSDLNSLILIVEDSDDDYEFTERALKMGNLSNPLKRCKSGEDALQYLFRSSPYSSESAPRPGLILLDLNMYGVDGREVLRQLKLDDKLKSIPVVVLTSSPHERDIQECYRLGANTYVQKPVSPEMFVQAIGCLKDFWLQIAILPKGDPTL